MRTVWLAMGKLAAGSPRSIATMPVRMNDWNGYRIRIKEF